MNRTEASGVFASADEFEQKAILAEACRRSLPFFVETFWPILEPGREYIPGWPVDAVSEHLKAVTTGDIRKLLITVPPGSMKSLLVRVFWPSWEWIHKPQMRYIGASYAEPLAMRDNRRARNIIESELYRTLFPHVRLSHDQSQKTNFANTSTGSMMATSVRGRATGERGDRFVVDDAHNVLEAESDTKRAETLQWFNEVVPSRVNDLDKSAFVVVMQRVHHDDVAAAAINQGYEHLLIPAHYDPERAKPTSIGWTDPRTEFGENFWPARYPDTALDQLRSDLGAYAYSAQYEQSPTPREGALFQVDKLRYIDDVPEGEIIWADGWDLAGTDEKENRTSAFTARVRAGYVVRTRRFVYAYAERRRIGPGAVEDWISSVADQISESEPDVKMVLPQDPGQAGKAQKVALGKLLAGVSHKFELQSGDKVTRATPLAGQVENGNVDIVKGPWNSVFVEELRQFPMSKYKDQVDAAASAFNAVAPRRKNKPDLIVMGSEVANRARV